MYHTTALSTDGISGGNNTDHTASARSISWFCTIYTARRYFAYIAVWYTIHRALPVIATDSVLRTPQTPRVLLYRSYVLSTFVNSNTRTAVVRLFVVRCTWQLYSMSCRWLFLFLLHNNRPMQTTVACLEPYWPQLQLYNKQYVRVRCNAAGCLVRRQPRSGTRAS